MPNTKKFLDADGVAYLASLLDNYPDNELLGTVITAIQEALEDKQDVLTPGSNISITNGVISATGSASGGSSVIVKDWTSADLPAST